MYNEKERAFYLFSGICVGNKKSMCAPVQLQLKITHCLYYRSGEIWNFSFFAKCDTQNPHKIVFQMFVSDLQISLRFFFSDICCLPSNTAW